MRFIAAIDTRIYGVAYAQGGEVDTSAWTRKQMLQFLGNGLIQASQITAGAIQDALTFTGGDVTTTVDAQGKLVVTIETQPKSIDWLTDVDTTTDPLLDGQVLVWDEIDALWKPATLDLSGASISIANLSDVDVAGALDGQVLTFDAASGHWVAGSAPLSSLVDLLDVDTSGGLNDGDVLIYDYTSGTWIPGIVTGAMGPAGPVCWSVPAPWSSSTPYTTGPPASVVTYLGSAYVCIQSHTNVLPTNGAYWRLLVAKGDKGDTGDVGPASTIPGPGVAAGGSTGQYLKKASAADYATTWGTLPNDLPTGGTTGQVLKKASATNYDATWADETGGTSLPTGGTTGQALVKASATDFDVAWGTVAGSGGHSLFFGNGAPGTVTGSADYDYYIDQSTGNVYQLLPGSGSTPVRMYEAATTATPTGSGSGTYVLGVEFYVTSLAMLDKISWMRLASDSVSTARNAAVYKASDGSLVANATPTAPSGTGWQDIPFASPPLLQPNTRYVAAVQYPGSVYAQTVSYYSSGSDEVDGLLTIPKTANATGSLQGRYIGSATMTMPNTSFSGASYWIDVEVTEATGWTLVGNTGAGSAIRKETFSWIGGVTLFTGTQRVYNDDGVARTISKVRVSAGTAPTGAALIVDIKKNGTTVFPTTAKPQVAIGANTGTAVPDTTSWANGDYLTVDVTQIGSTVAGSDLTIEIVYR